MPGLTVGEVVTIDGNAFRGTRQADGKAIVHLVSAWANVNNMGWPNVRSMTSPTRLLRFPSCFGPWS